MFTSLVTWVLCSSLDTGLCVLKCFNGSSYACESNFIPWWQLGETVLLWSWKVELIQLLLGDLLTGFCLLSENKPFLFSRTWVETPKLATMPDIILCPYEHCTSERNSFETLLSEFCYWAYSSHKFKVLNAYVLECMFCRWSGSDSI